MQTNNSRKPVAFRYLLLFFVFTIPIAWFFWIPMIMINKGLWSPPVPVPTLVWSSLGALSPLISIALIERISHKEVQLSRIFTQIRLKEWKSRSLLASSLFLICVHIILNLVYFGVEAFRGTGTGTIPVFNLQVFSELGWFILLIMPVHFITALVTSPLFEEPGWRGFVFTNLKEYLPRDIASLIVGSYWWLWHQGMNIAFDMNPSLPGYISMLLDSWAIDALFTLSKGNVFAAMLAHQAIGTINTFLYPLPDLWYLLLVKFIVIFALRLKVRYRT